MLGRKAFDEVVGVLGEAHLERPDGGIVAPPVEDDDGTRAAEGHVARQPVDEVAAVAKRPRVEDVVAVEEVEHLAKDARVDAERAYLSELARRVQAALQGQLVGLYAGGSYALGGYEPGRSDLDVAVVVRHGLGRKSVDALVAAVRHESLPSPARKLELVVYTVQAAGSGTVAPSVELNLNTGPDEFLAQTEIPPGEGHWFAIDRSILAEHGLALVGPPASDVFVSPPREGLLSILADLLRWYLREDPESDDALLNAGRALGFARNGRWTPKPTVRRWAREQEGTSRDVLERAVTELEDG
jgi:predicted nucleotidyltransferase